MEEPQRLRKPAQDIINSKQVQTQSRNQNLSVDSHKRSNVKKTAGSGSAMVPKWLMFGALGILLIGIGVGVFLLTRPKPFIPHEISKDVTFVMMYPSIEGEVTIDKTTLKYDRDLKQFSFIAKYAGKNITFAEQTTPDAMVDIPDYYTKFVEKMNAYGNFENNTGKVDLTRPTEIGDQVAVMKAKGTLLFAKTDGDLDNEAWKRLFNSLQIVQPK